MLRSFSLPERSASDSLAKTDFGFPGEARIRSDTGPDSKTRTRKPDSAPAAAAPLADRPLLLLQEDVFHLLACSFTYCPANSSLLAQLSHHHHSPAQWTGMPMRDSKSPVTLIERSGSISALVLHEDSKPAVRSLAERRLGHQRKYAPKVRTGCGTCKIRRVKCDEEKPSCRRCTSTGRKCDGYSSPSDSESPPAECLTVTLSTSIPGAAREKRTFDFFRSRTAPCIAGNYQDPVWDRIVLQLSHSEPAVRYAANALAALHEETDLRNAAAAKDDVTSLVPNDFPVQQYSKALDEMQRLMQSGTMPLNTLLLCSLICVHFESLRESFVPSLMHAENAIKLLNASITSDARKVNPNLVRALMRIDLQGIWLMGMRVPGRPFYTAATDSVLPHTFRDISQARDLISTWTCRLFHFMRTVAYEYKLENPGNVPIELYAEAQEYEDVMLRLDSLLWDYMHRPSVKLNMREQHGLAMLRSRVKINRVLAAGCLYTETTVYDQYLPVFQDILAICLFIMTTDHASRRLLSVSLDTGLIHPLFFIAILCRDSRIRHQALDQLKLLRAADGIWHLETAIQVCEICVEHEEAACDTRAPTCADIPEWKRVHSGFDGWEDGVPKAAVDVHLRTRPNGMDGEWAETTRTIEDEAVHVPMLELQKFAMDEPGLANRMRTMKIISWP